MPSQGELREESPHLGFWNVEILGHLNTLKASKLHYSALGLAFKCSVHPDRSLRMFHINKHLDSHTFLQPVNLELAS